MDLPAENATLSYERTFTVEDVKAFAEISHDRGAHHVEPGPGGRVMVHGLLTATLPTKLGGDLDYLARTMRFEFVRPVFTGDRIVCDCTAAQVEERPGRIYIEFDIRCRNQDGEEVLTGSTAGVVLRP